MGDFGIKAEGDIDIIQWRKLQKLMEFRARTIGLKITIKEYTNNIKRSEEEIVSLSQTIVELETELKSLGLI